MPTTAGHRAGEHPRVCELQPDVPASVGRHLVAHQAAGGHLQAGEVLLSVFLNLDIKLRVFLSSSHVTHAVSTL